MQWSLQCFRLMVHDEGLPLPTHRSDGKAPQAHDRAFDIAGRDPPSGISPKAAAVVIAEVLESIGDTCPECPPD